MSKKPETKKVKTYSCRDCGAKFPGTGKKGRPFQHCPACRK